MSVPLPIPPGSAPADPQALTLPPKHLALKTAALEALDCEGQLRKNLEMAIELMTQHGYERGLETIADHGCVRGAESAAAFWYTLGDEGVAKVDPETTKAFLWLMKRHQAAVERVGGNRLMTHGLADRAANAMAVHGDPTGNLAQYPIS